MPEHQPYPPEFRSLNGASILVADDSALIRDAIKTMLERAGARVRLARNGKEVLDLTFIERFDCVLLDIQMPEMDGLEAARRLRSNPDTACLRIIAISGNSGQKEREAWLAVGMDDFIAKPFAAEELFTVLEKWLPQYFHNELSPDRAEHIAMEIEQFCKDTDIEFRISSRKEMLSIFQDMATQGDRVALHYGNGQHLIMTSLTSVGEHGIWLAASTIQQQNTRLLLSDKFTFVGMNQQVKIQFTGCHIENDLTGDSEELYLELPDYLLRIQRRKYFRAAVPATIPVKCIIPITPEISGQPAITCVLPVVDISGGGIGLLYDGTDDTFLPEKVFMDCRITIPDIGTLTATIEVRNSRPLSPQKQAVGKRIGCRFVQLSEQMDTLLQRYITFLQSVYIHTARKHCRQQ